MATQTNYAKIGYYSDEFSASLSSITSDMIDSCLATGYNGILFELTVPVANDGSLQDTLHFDHMFELAKGLQAQGIKTGMLLNWNFNGENASYVGQEALGQTRPAEFSMDNMLAGMDRFLRDIAPKAESSGIDLISIANQQPDFFDEEYYGNWKSTIQEIRKQYTGKLTLSVNSDDKYTSGSVWPLIGIWDLLDEMTFWARPYISETPLTQSSEMLSGHFLSALDGSSFVNEVIQASIECDKPVNLIYVAMALPNAFDGGWDPTVSQAQQVPLPVRRDLQLLAYESFLQIVNDNLFDFVDTIILGNYDPWTVNPSLGNPPGPDVDPGEWAVWNSFKSLDLSSFPDQLHQYLRQYLAGTADSLVPGVTYGSKGDDWIYTNGPSQTVRLLSGVDRCHGGEGQENYVASPKVSDWEVGISVGFWVTSVADLDSSVEVYRAGKKIGTFKPTTGLADFKANTWVSADFNQIDFPQGEGGQIAFRFISGGGSGFAAVDELTFDDRTVDINQGTSASAEKPTWAEDNWILPGLDLSYDLSGFMSPSATVFSTLDGGGNIDSIRFDLTRSRSSFSVGRLESAWTIADPSGQYDTIKATEVERLHFSDVSLALDLDGHAGLAAEFIGMLAPDTLANPQIVGMILGFFDAGTSMTALCQLALDAGLVRQFAGSDSQADLARLMFRNVIGSEADAATVDALVACMDGRTDDMSRAEFMAAVAGLEVNQAHVNLVGLKATGIEYV
jgi:hypothetical protein